MRRSRLNVFRTVAEALLHAERERAGFCRHDASVQAVATPGGRLDAEQTERRTDAQRNRERIAGKRLRGNAQRPRIGRLDESRTACEDRSPRTPEVVETAGEENRQLPKKMAMLLGH